MAVEYPCSSHEYYYGYEELPYLKNGIDAIIVLNVLLSTVPVARGTPYKTAKTLESRIHTEQYAMGNESAFKTGKT